MTLKVLALHGSQQNAEIFRSRLGRIVPKVKNFASFTFVDAPHTLPQKDGDDVSLRTWYTRNSSGIVQSSVDESIAFLLDLWAKRGPFDGIIGFSQGGAICALMACRSDLFLGLKFVILAGAPNIEDLHFPASKKLSEMACSATPQTKLSIRSLHFAGLSDAVVLPESSSTLASRFESPLYIEHPQGHCIPTKPHFISIISEFLESQLLSRLNANLDIECSANSNQCAKQERSSEAKARGKETKADTKAALKMCTSDSNAAEQQEEVEAITAIYPEEDIRIIRPAPSDISMPSACFSIQLIPKSGNMELIPPSWIGEISLLIEFPPGYPGDADSDPVITVEVGTLSMMDFPGSYKKALALAVMTAAKQNSRSPCAFSCIQAAKEWLSSESWKNLSKNVPLDVKSKPDCSAGQDPVSDSLCKTGHVSDTRTLIGEINAGGWKGNNVAPVVINEEDEDRKEKEQVKVATEEACLVSATVLRRRFNKYVTRDSLDTTEVKGGDALGSCKTKGPVSGSVSGSGGGGGGRVISADDSDASYVLEERVQREAALSARGVWGYTVGLVGKPSAGKSTFFNAATCAALRSEDGRKMADVAPHPFTTIEPNIGPGWFAGPADQSTLSDRSAAYGRDRDGCRLLPVMIKDVAGLVPGAYKGRGKGNRFLADLCDADVLVHVVDATGQSDKDGNVLGKGETGSSPSEDAQWIREELHRWIHGNIKAKWPSVCRKGIDSANRVVQLFTGYKGPRFCVETAAIRSKLGLATAPAWTSLDLHRFVAHYMSVRFPICLALNKIDALPDVRKVEIRGEGRESVVDGDVIQLCQHQAINRGELAMPVSAFAETWEILKQAHTQTKASKNASSIIHAHAAMEESGEKYHDAAYVQHDDVRQLKEPVVNPMPTRNGKTHNVEVEVEVVEEEEVVKKKEVKAFIPVEGSAAWIKNEAVLEKVKRLWGTTGVLDAVSAAVSIKPPVYCYPVGDLTLESPVGWAHTVGGGDASVHDKGIPLTASSTSTISSSTSSSSSSSSSGGSVPRLRDCLLMHPGSTVGDLYDALKRGALPHVTVHGDFVRAEGKSLDCYPGDDVTAVNGSTPNKASTVKKRQLGRDAIIDDTCCVIRIQTNRKSIWQQSYNAIDPAPPITSK